MPVLVRLLLLVCVAWCVLYEARALGVPGLPVGDVKLMHLLVMGIGAGLCLSRATVRREERAAWMLIGLALASWIAGEAYFTHVLWDDSQPPVPSWADAGYLGLPPLLFAGLALLLCARIRGLPRTLWVDGITAALAAGAVSAAVVVQAVLGSAAGGSLALATNLVYPLADLVLVGIIAGGLAASGWRVDRTFGLIVAAVLSFWLADSVYLVQVAHGAWVSGSPIELGWWAAALLLAGAAWQSPAAGARGVARRRAGRLVIAMPIAFAMLALGVLVSGSIGQLNGVAIALATASLGGVMVRLVLTFQQHSAMLQRSQREALTDALTGMGNRRALLGDLESALARAGEAHLLLLFDLNGFKAYNDTFGHAAGDRLLARLGQALTAAIGHHGRAYRLGGDEFCALIGAAGNVEALPAAALRALAADGPGFTVSAAAGVARLPDEAANASDALTLADQRMYAAKSGSRGTAALRQVRDVLLGVLNERDGLDEDRVHAVAHRARIIGEHLGLDREQLDALARAAELHDIGTAAVPDAILTKPAPLSAHEWTFVRAHPLIGERVLNRAPALRPVAALVRAVHERVDGTGYPDGLRGDEIPLGARIIAVCDAFEAMTRERPHRPTRSVADALAELRRGAGTQFDARIVEIFCVAAVQPAVIAGDLQTVAR